MATVTRYIYSHYDPEEREKLEAETGQLVLEEEDPEKAWHREASRIARQTAPPPYFVPATIPYDQWSSETLNKANVGARPKDPLGSSVSGWYHSLTAPTLPSRRLDASSLKAKSSPIKPPLAKKIESRNKNNWFIMKAIQSEPPSSSVSVPPSLADMLARHPPPLPSEEKYAPPVFLEIGPSNKGFGMLQRSGWNEGEPLGPDVIRRKPADEILPDGDMIPTKTIQTAKSKGKRKMTPSRHPNATTLPSRQKIVEVKMENFDDVSELRSVDVIDLTVSDSESEFSTEVEDEEPDLGHQEPEHDAAAVHASAGVDTSKSHLTLPNDLPAPYARKALLTPIATVLKSDRLGIGLKAKTVGPYKASQKRVTHNTAAMAAHVKAAEESRKRKQLYGRGHRGFERQQRRDEEHRKSLLAELKNPW